MCDVVIDANKICANRSTQFADISYTKVSTLQPLCRTMTGQFIRGSVTDISTLVGQVLEENFIVKTQLNRFIQSVHFAGLSDFLVRGALRRHSSLKWRSPFAGSSDGNMNVPSACALNTRYIHIYKHLHTQ
jgi:hypothetical protein